MTDSTLARLILLCHHRWAVPILAELATERGAKFVLLVHRLGISPDSLRRTLAALIAGGWVERNPGHGHPLRPEYILTPIGAAVAPTSQRLMRTLERLGIRDAMLRKWSLPVVLAVRRGLERFNEIAAFLPGLSPRALALALKDLQAHHMLHRSIADGHPPTTWYALTSEGRRVARLLEHF